MFFFCLICICGTMRVKGAPVEGSWTLVQLSFCKDKTLSWSLDLELWIPF